MATAVWLLPALLLVALSGGPKHEEVEGWLGRWAAGPEEVGFRWEGGLLYDHGNIEIPVDGEWHVSVPEFLVRHRATWIAEKEAIRLEETHDRSAPWSYELSLDSQGNQLEKSTVQNGERVVVRTFVRRGRF